MRFPVFLTLLGVLAAVQAQDSGENTTILPITPGLCNATYSMPINAANFAGTWYEGALLPIPPTPVLCAEAQFNAGNSSDLDLVFTYSNSTTSPWINYTSSADVPVQTSTSSPSGYNISLFGQYATYKLLAVDFANFAIICGYTNASDMSTSFGVLLTRTRDVVPSVLNGYLTEASKLYANFQTQNITFIYQNSSCWSIPDNSTSSQNNSSSRQMLSSLLVFYSTIFGMLLMLLRNC